MQVERQIELRTEVVTSVLTRKLNAYNGAKRARRLLRAQAVRAVDKTSTGAFRAYDDQMLAITIYSLTSRG
jgi:hypothetical protein